jgi:hypothetical protein
MVAVVNPISSCGAASSYAAMSAFIRCGIPPAGLGSDLYAEIVSNLDTSDLTATVIGRKLTRLKILNLFFRTQTRLSTSLVSSIVGQGLGANDLSSYIKGIPHEDDLGASITAVRYVFTPIPPLALIDVYKEGPGGSAYLYKQLKLSLSGKVDTYVYESIGNALYSIGDGRWVLNVSEFTGDDTSFYDRNTGDKDLNIDSLLEFSSIDDAIRGAIRILTEMHRSELTADIAAIGGYLGMRADIVGVYADRVSDLRASITLVNNIPDLYASISAFSGYRGLSASVTGYGSEVPLLYADLRGVVYDVLWADITGVT